MEEPVLETETVRHVLAVHAPALAALPLSAVASPGTDNALWRLGDDLVVRIPRRAEAVAAFRKEMEWLSHLSALPLDVPEPVLIGQSDAMPHGAFGVARWIPGEIAAPEKIADPEAAATALAAFLTALRALPTDGAPRAGAANYGRGIPLTEMTERILPAIDLLGDEIDAIAGREMWLAASAVPFEGRPTWLHGDLKDDNLIAREGALCGVIDWGLASVGDPAADTMAAWTWIAPAARDAFRDALGVPEAEWLRAQGWALYAGAIALSYYRMRGHADLCRISRRTLARLGLMRERS
ncbi:MAG: phosphotransferase [Pseudomonadota bacterium]